MKNFEKFKNKQISAEDAKTVVGGVDCFDCPQIAIDTCDAILDPLDPAYGQCYIDVTLVCYQYCEPEF